KMNPESIAPRLKFEPADAGQANVEDDAPGAIVRAGVEEFLNRRIGADVQADGRKQQTERLARRYVIVDHMDGGPIIPRTASFASRSGHGHSFAIMAERLRIDARRQVNRCESA